MGEVTGLRISALADQVGKVIGNEALSVEVLPNGVLHQVAAWPDTIGDVKTALLAQIGADTVTPSQIAVAGDAVLFWIEPLKFWVLNHVPDPVDAETGALLDQSHGFVQLRFTGTDVALHLNKFLSLDLRDSSFPDRATAMSDIHHVAVRLWRRGDDYHLLIPRGFAKSLFALIAPAQ